jgi:hypothetical protein
VLRRLLLVVLVLGAWLLWRWWRKRRGRAPLLPGSVPKAWERLGASDARFAEALDLRARLAALVEDPESVVDRAFVAEVDGVLEGLFRLVDLRLRLERHVAGLRAGPTGLAPPERASVEALIGRVEAMDREAAETVSDLRRTYLDLLQGAAGVPLGRADAVARAQALRETVKERLEAAAEVSQDLER